MVEIERMSLMQGIVISFGFAMTCTMFFAFVSKPKEQLNRRAIEREAFRCGELSKEREQKEDETNAYDAGFVAGQNSSQQQVKKKEKELIIQLQIENEKLMEQATCAEMVLQDQLGACRQKIAFMERNAAMGCANYEYQRSQLIKLHQEKMIDTQTRYHTRTSDVQQQLTRLLHEYETFKHEMIQFKEYPKKIITSAGLSIQSKLQQCCLAYEHQLTQQMAQLRMLQTKHDALQTTNGDLTTEKTTLGEKIKEQVRTNHQMTQEVHSTQQELEWTKATLGEVQTQVINTTKSMKYRVKKAYEEGVLAGRKEWDVEEEKLKDQHDRMKQKLLHDIHELKVSMEESKDDNMQQYEMGYQKGLTMNQTKNQLKTKEIKDECMREAQLQVKIQLQDMTEGMEKLKLENSDLKRQKCSMAAMEQKLIRDIDRFKERLADATGRNDSCYKSGYDQGQQDTQMMMGESSGGGGSSWQQQLEEEYVSKLNKKKNEIVQLKHANAMLTNKNATFQAQVASLHAQQKCMKCDERLRECAKLRFEHAAFRPNKKCIQCEDRLKECAKLRFEQAAMNRQSVTIRKEMEKMTKETEALRVKVHAMENATSFAAAQSHTREQAHSQLIRKVVGISVENMRLRDPKAHEQTEFKGFVFDNAPPSMPLPPIQEVQLTVPVALSSHNNDSKTQSPEDARKRIESMTFNDLEVKSTYKRVQMSSNQVTNDVVQQTTTTTISQKIKKKIPERSRIRFAFANDGPAQN